MQDCRPDQAQRRSGSGVNSCRNGSALGLACDFEF
jgi:hypothetical protein